ncbi:hypothetical protein RHMOL_Rhmol04G0228200 [Rhododendron molle]|uniref:Uncharacterized protein n=1 Tax=Rhododendron molle TaxID=49168 RepID=A0ACC0P4L5_RHOML|nr:hypothetical protein RHMOL_Rhmol04G0228200 [Rhododendron molle]
MSLKKAVDNLFCRLGLSIGRLRGQGYDGASNMQGEINGLKALILKENSSAYYVHCFAHQLQLALVAVAKKDDRIGYLLESVSKIGTVVGASCKRRDILRENEVERVVKALNLGEIESGRGLNQETSLKRPRDTRWSSHYSSSVRLMGMFASAIGVLEIVEEDGFQASSVLEVEDHEAGDDGELLHRQDREAGDDGKLLLRQDHKAGDDGELQSSVT